jgi:hypothetical protein
METTLSPKKRYRNHFAKHEIPKSLMYEMYDGKPMYYKGYKDVMNQRERQKSNINFNQRLILVNTVLQNLMCGLDYAKYFVGGNGVSLQISENTITTSNILVFKKHDLKQVDFDAKYFNIPPLVTIEFDFIAETVDFGLSEFDYYSMKTKSLLDFGVKEVIWFFSTSKQVAIARPNQDWIITNWDKELVVLDEYKFSLEKLLEKEGFKL